MAVCLDYQSVYYRRRPVVVSVRTQVALGLVLIVVLASRVWIRIESTNLGYALAKERQATVELDMERRELELQLSVLERPDNLAKLAKKRLGLAALDPRQARRIVE